MSIRKTFISVAVLAALGACSQPQVPKDKYYRLQVEKPQAASTTPLLKGTVEVERFIADGLTAGRPIVYSNTGTPHELQEYHYHFWTEPPVVMLRDQLIDYLRAANVADLVVSPETRVRADYLITAHIKRLENIGNAKSAIVELELRLQNMETGKVLYLKDQAVQMPAKSLSVSDSVIALNKALAETYADFVEGLKKL